MSDRDAEILNRIEGLDAAQAADLVYRVVIARHLDGLPGVTVAEAAVRGAVDRMLAVIGPARALDTVVGAACERWRARVGAPHGDVIAGMLVRAAAHALAGEPDVKRRVTLAYDAALELTRLVERSAGITAAPSPGRE